MFTGVVWGLGVRERSLLLCLFLWFLCYYLRKKNMTSEYACVNSAGRQRPTTDMGGLAAHSVHCHRSLRFRVSRPLLRPFIWGPVLSPPVGPEIPSSLNCYFKSDASWEIVSCKSLRTTGEHSTLCAFPSVQSHTTGEKRGGFRQESQNLKKMNKRRTSNLRTQTPSPTGHPVTQQAQGNVNFSNLFF